jgi:hypothetical protein
MDEETLPTPDGVISFLEEQHEELKGAMPEVLEVSGQERLQAFGKIRRMLALHESIEQAAVHPTARAEADGSQAADGRLREEHEATEAIARLEGIDVDSDAFDAGYRQLMSDVVEHAEREEHEEFIHIATFSSDALALVARGMAIAKRGHEAVGGSTFADMLANASTSIHQA